MMFVLPVFMPSEKSTTIQYIEIQQHAINYVVSPGILNMKQQAIQNKLYQL